MNKVTLLVCSFLIACNVSKKETTADAWITNPDRLTLFAKVEPILFEEKSSATSVIVIDTTTRYQSMDGFGYSLTGGSAQLIYKLNERDRSKLLNELFRSDENNIGVSYLRISIGASDLDDHVFSYNDLSSGQSDETLSKFSLDPDRTSLLPVLKEILAINPKIKIMGSPWSPPTWMKDNNLPKGGSLLQKYYSVYAAYFVRYIHEMKKEGISIDAITIQNEPENPGNTPSMLMTSDEQSDFIKNHLGPAFKDANVATKIILFDHNCDHPEYPIAILNDPQTKPFVDGSAFHMYLGEITALDSVHSIHPDKSIYFTEQWTSGKGDFAGDLRWHVKTLIVGAPRNWSRNVIEWNLAADEKFNPHTPDGGCTLCQGALTINSTTNEITRNVSYYIIAHASKFVKPGSVRIATEVIDNLFNVAYLTPDGKRVMIVINDNDASKTFSILDNGLYATATLNSGAVGTYIW
ncbi:glucosylceramidase [soil metagenome]